MNESAEQAVHHDFSNGRTGFIFALDMLFRALVQISVERKPPAESHARAVSLLESLLYKSDQQQATQYFSIIHNIPVQATVNRYEPLYNYQCEPRYTCTGHRISINTNHSIPVQATVYQCKPQYTCTCHSISVQSTVYQYRPPCISTSQSIHVYRLQYQYNPQYIPVQLRHCISL